MSSAANTRGLIEARWRRQAVAVHALPTSSAANTRGLIEAEVSSGAILCHRRIGVFRGEYPRPH